jgi:hypothetical protein
MPCFSRSIYKLGINPVVDPPDRVMKLIFAEAGKSAGPIPVRGKINGSPFIQTLVKYQAAWRLYINAAMLKGSGLKVGDTANVELQFDPEPRRVSMPKRFADALIRDATARAAFHSLSPSRQKEILKYLSSLKTEAAIERNVEAVMRKLRSA